MFNSLIIKSKISGTYTVDFITDLNKQLSQLNDNKSIFVIDKNVLNLFPESFKLIKSSSRLVIIESGERNKTIEYCQFVIKNLIELHVRKDDRLIAIGGGVTQDIVAFISSILFRGLSWEFFPTTLLAQCDSCIGSKSSINFDSYKNLLGTFNPPKHIYIYNEFLNTLSESEVRSGIGEMLHYFLTDGITLAKEITDRISEIISDRSRLEYFIKNSLNIKQKIIEIDEFDESIRHIFNYGHTFGHALEAITNYSISHGQSVTLGMDLANYISMKLELLNSHDFKLMHKILQKNIPEYEFTDDNIFNYLNALSKDKKNKGDKIGCILSKGPGKVEKRYIENNEWLRKTILDYSNFLKVK